MFTNIKDIKSITECGALQAYCQQQFSLATSRNTDLVRFMDMTLGDLYGKMDYLDKYDSKPKNLGLGNIIKLYQDMAKKKLSAEKGNVPIKLPLAITQLNECANDLTELLISNSEDFTAFAIPENQPYVEAVATRMSEDSNRFNYFDSLLKAFKCALYYGIAAIDVSWAEDSVNAVHIQSLTETPSSGVDYTVINPACLYYSKLADMRKFSTDGDFCAIVTSEPKTAVINENYNDGLMPEALDSALSAASKYVSAFDSNDPRLFDYIMNFAPYQIDNSSNEQFSNFVAKTVIYVRVIPELVGIKATDEIPPMQKTLLRLTYIGDQLINCEVSDNGIIPVVIADLSELVSAGQNLAPVQKFTNFLMSIKQAGDTKRIYGMNFFDRNRINVNDITAAKEKDTTSPWIPVALNDGESMGSAILHFNDAPDTQHIINDIAQMKDIMQIILPTDTAALMGNLDRATEWQARKALEYSGKSTKLLARQLQASLLIPLKSLHIQTIFENELTLPVKTEDGSTIDMPVSAFAGREIVYSITTAMTGVDRDIKAQQMDTFINRLIQLPNVSQEYDLTRLFDYQSSLSGHKINFTDFKRKSPIDNMPKELRDQAYQLLQQALAAQQENEQIPIDNTQKI